MKVVVTKQFKTNFHYMEGYLRKYTDKSSLYEDFDSVLLELEHPQYRYWVEADPMIFEDVK